MQWWFPRFICSTKHKTQSVVKFVNCVVNVKINCVQKTKLSKVNECIVSCYVHVQHIFTPLVSFPSHPPSHSYTGSTILPTFCRGVLPRLHTPFFPLNTVFASTIDFSNPPPPTTCHSLQLVWVVDPTTIDTHSCLNCLHQCKLVNHVPCVSC